MSYRPCKTCINKNTELQGNEKLINRTKPNSRLYEPHNETTGNNYQPQPEISQIGKHKITY